MRSFSKYFLIISVCAVSFFFCSKEKDSKIFQTTIKDELGFEVSFNKIPERIASTAPSITEIIYKLNLEDKLVGVTSFCNFPAQTKEKTVVGDLLNVNIEKLLELKIDLVFITVEGNTKSSYEKIRKAGITVFTTNPRSLNGINNTIRNIAQIFKINNLADSIIADYNSRVKSIQNKLINKTPPTCMFIVSTAPLILAGGNTFIDEIITKSGFQNIAKNSKVPYPQYSREEILKLNPKYIIIPSVSKVPSKEFTDIYKEWRYLTAIKENNILNVEPDIFLRPGPRYIDAIELLSKFLIN